MNASSLRVAVTGAAGQIGYSLLFRIASGAMFGPDQPVILHLIEIETVLPAIQGVVMELDDCAFPLLKGIVPTANLDEGFRGVNWALLVGSVPRKQGMERKDLLGINGKIFIGQGNAIQKNAASDVRIHVVGNPCNTKARGLSSAASAANAVVDSVRSIVTPTAPGDWHSVCLCSDGSYGIEKDLICSFPVRSNGSKLEIVQGLSVNEFSRGKIDATVNE